MYKREYAQGTYTVYSMARQSFITARVLCEDGKVRNVKRIAPTADTFFSIPASVSVKGKTVSGFVTIETMQGNSIPSDNDPEVAKFVANKYRKNGNVFE